MMSLWKMLIIIKLMMIVSRVADADVLRDEQLKDKSLQPCWEMAKQGKGGFIIKNQLLYHVEKVESIGEKCVQLCLPEGRRPCLGISTQHQSRVVS